MLCELTYSLAPSGDGVVLGSLRMCPTTHYLIRVPQKLSMDPQHKGKEVFVRLHFIACEPIKALKSIQLLGYVANSINTNINMGVTGVF